MTWERFKVRSSVVLESFADNVLVTVINYLPAEVAIPQNHSFTRTLFKIPLKTYLFLPEEKEAASDCQNTRLLNQTVNNFKKLGLVAFGCHLFSRYVNKRHINSPSLQSI